MERPTRQRERDTETERAAQETEGERLCSECESANLITSADQGELVCDDCGLILEEDTIDHGPEWRAFTHSERQSKSRVGAPTTKTMHDKGLTTQIGWQNKDAYGRSLSSEKRTQMNRLRKWQERVRTKDAGERNLQFALSETDRMASALGVPRSVREEASLVEAKDAFDDVLRWIIEANETRLLTLDFEALRTHHDRLDKFHARCETVTRKRQSLLHATTSAEGQAGISQRELVECLYVAFPVRYPVLSTVVRVEQVCNRCQRALRDHLVRRV